MAAGKEIRGKIKSVENTKKITKAMEMVAASKMRKAQERMKMARPYAEKIRTVAAHMSHAHPEYVHPFFRSNSNINSFRQIPPLYPPMPPSFAITRWQGMMIGIGFLPLAFATARTAFS